MTKEIKDELKSVELNPFKRLQHSTPKYFKILIGFGITLIGLAFAILELPQDLKQGLPDEVIAYAKYVVAIGGTIVFVAGQTIDKDKVVEKLKEKYNEDEEED